MARPNGAPLSAVHPRIHVATVGAGTRDDRTVRIVAFDVQQPRHGAAFRVLNLAWIAEHFAVEPRDEYELDEPQSHILAAGGHILVAERVDGDRVDVVGVCALLHEHDGVYELAKMAVDPSARGRGVGRALIEAASETARQHGATRIELLSNTALVPAIGLYRALGFVEVRLPPNDYARANIAMVRDLGTDRA